MLSGLKRLKESEELESVPLSTVRRLEVGKLTENQIKLIMNTQARVNILAKHFKVSRVTIRYHQTKAIKLLRFQARNSQLLEYLKSDECPRCSSRTFIEALVSPYGPTIPVESGNFDLVCFSGHRFHYYPEVFNNLEKESPNGTGVSKSTKQSSQGDYVSVPIRGEAPPQMASASNNPTKVKWREMPGDLRPLWSLLSSEQRGESNNKCTSHSHCPGEFTPEECRARWGTLCPFYALRGDTLTSE